MSGEAKLNVARLGVIDYQTALELQSALVVGRMRDTIDDTLLLLEHPHVYTLGRGADEGFVLDPPAEVPIQRVSRGGQVTYHGPGQLVGYPILKLEGAERDVIRYLRKLEQVIVDALAAAGIEAQRREGLTGVWVGERKNRFDWRRNPSLDDAARVRGQRRDRSPLLRAHRAVRNRGMPHDVDRAARTP